MLKIIVKVTIRNFKKKLAILILFNPEVHKAIKNSLSFSNFPIVKIDQSKMIEE